MSNFTEITRIVEEVVRVPIYTVLGVTHGKLVYLATEEGKTDLWSLDLKTHEKNRLTRIGIFFAAKPVPASPLVFYAVDATKGREQHKLYAVDAVTGEQAVEVGIEPRRIFGIGWDGRTVAFSSATAESMELWSAKEDGSARKLMDTDKLMFVSDIEGSVVAGSGNLRDNPRSMELFFYDMKSGEFREYTVKEGSTNKEPILRDGKALFTTNAFGREKLMLLDLDSMKVYEPELRSDEYKARDITEYLNYGWTEGGTIWFIGKKNGHTYLFLDGKEIPIPSGYTQNVAFVDGKAYLAWSSLISPPEIVSIDLESGEMETILRAEVSEEVKSRLGKVDFVKIKSPDGVEVPTFIIESKQALKPGPTVVYVHGGPWSEVANSWSIFIEALVASGYHVVAPNFRGSTGYGEEYRQMDIGDPGGGDLEDVVAAAKWARENKLASKVAIMGYSYGGFMTFLATAKRPEVWDAGVAGAGITDWEEMYYLADALFKKFEDILFDYKKDLWKDRSAIYFVENVRAPLCIIHPQNDTRTPLKPVLRYISKLMELGRTFEVHIIPDIGHAPRRVSEFVKICLPAITFLNEYLKGQRA